MIWKILYSPYDAGALIIMVIGLAAHVAANRFGGWGGDPR